MEKKNHSHSLTSMNIDDVYQKVELLNHGELCEVYSCKYMMKHNKQFVALKIYDNTKVSKEEWTKEVDLLLNVSHDNCISFLASSQAEEVSYIVMELSEGQNLQQILDASESKTLEQKHAANCIYHILRGIRYLHKHGIVHGNICYQNVVYHAPTNVWKICGFGSATLKQNNLKYTKESFPRVKEFLAPELEKESEEQWDLELIDEWGLGIVMYLVLVGEAPWKGENREIEWDKVNNEVATSLLAQLLTVNSKRLKAEEALKHRWFIEQLQEKTYFTGHIFLQD
uniref:Protein kinase domain-containing protein n=1 Tax=Arcella intermedia TaxID=1963864 RepID=A0A6B2LCN2_9EUKA